MIGIIGINGKMGSFFADVINREDIIGYDVIENSKYKTYLNYEDFFNNEIELVIDFSNSELSKIFLLECLNRRIKIISGTSNIPNIEDIAKKALLTNVSFVYLENFSNGINQLVGFLENIECNNIEIVEEHNRNKKDISQTAKTIAKQLSVEHIDTIRTIKKESNHYIKFYFEGEEIEIIHKCKNYNAYKQIFLDEYNKILSSNFYYRYGIIKQS